MVLLEHPLVQVGMASLLSLSEIFLLGCGKAFSRPVDNHISIFNEFALLAIYGLLCFAHFSDLELSQTLIWIALSSMILTNLVNTITFLALFF